MTRFSCAVAASLIALVCPSIAQSDNNSTISQLAQILANSSCPSVNPNEVELANSIGTKGWCSAGQFGQNQCNLPIEQCKQLPYYNLVAQGINQDSLYSTNPPEWWQCTYSTPSVTTVNGTEETTYTTSLHGVVDPACFTDSSKCVPLRYMSQVNTLNSTTGRPMWIGQQFPPYSRLDRPPVALVVAGAAFANMSLFYPYVDVIQLLQIQGSANASFLSSSSSTRIVVEHPGGVISTSRSRFSSDCSVVVPFFTVIIDLDLGYPVEARWEDDCSTCQSDSFVYSDDGGCNCGVPLYACYGYDNSSTVIPASPRYAPGTVDCDLKVYIAYSGKDRHGTGLTSQARTIKSFRKWSFGSLYNNIVGTVDNLPEISGNFQACREYSPSDPTVCLVPA